MFNSFHNTIRLLFGAISLQFRM